MALFCASLRPDRVRCDVGSIAAGAADVDLDNPAQWGRLVADYGGASVYVREFGGGIRIITHVTWAGDRGARGR
jgi:hypothetical protein